MRTFIVPALIAAGLALAATSPAFSQAGVYVGPGGVGVDIGRPGYRDPPPRYDGRRGYREERRDESRIGEREARRIARDNGVREIFSVDRRGPNWIVRGDGRRGPVTVWVDARSGNVRIMR